MKPISLAGTVLSLTVFFSLQLSAQSFSYRSDSSHSKEKSTNQVASSYRASHNIIQPAEPSGSKSIPVNDLATSFQVKGFIQIRYQAFQNKKLLSNTGFDVRRARLDIRGGFSPKWDYRLQVEFGGTSVKPLDIYVVYKPLGDYLKFTAGQFYIPFSLENTFSTPELALIDRSQVVTALVGRSGDKSNGLIDSVGNQNGRDVGLQASGRLIKYGSGHLLDYYIAVLNGAGINGGDNNRFKDISTRIVFHPTSIVDIGGSYYDGRDNFISSPTITQKRIRWGLELALIYKALSLKSEFIKGIDGNPSSKQRIDHEGGYAQAACFILPKKLQVVFSYDTYDPNTNNAYLQSTYYIIGFNYFMNTWAKIQVDYRKAQGEGPVNAQNDLFSAQLQLQF